MRLRGFHRFNQIGSFSEADGDINSIHPGMEALVEGTCLAPTSTVRLWYIYRYEGICDWTGVCSLLYSASPNLSILRVQHEALFNLTLIVRPPLTGSANSWCMVKPTAPRSTRFLLVCNRRTKNIYFSMVLIQYPEKKTQILVTAAAGKKIQYFWGSNTCNAILMHRSTQQANLGLI